MRHVIVKYGDYLYVVNFRSNFTVGYARWVDEHSGRKLKVSSAISGELCTAAAFVSSVDEVVPALKRIWKENPPSWEIEHRRREHSGEDFLRYVKTTEYALLSVDEVGNDQWVAYRDEEGEQQELLNEELIAVFSSSEEAMRLADLHERDGYPDCVAIQDGFRWLNPPADWRAEPYVLQNLLKAAVAWV